MLELLGRTRMISRDESVAPDIVEELFLRDQPAALFEEVPEHVEHLWFERLDTVGAADLDAVGVDGVAAEPVNGHVTWGARRLP